jgi:predicted nicotinamide N-methyase
VHAADIDENALAAIALNAAANQVAVTPLFADLSATDADGADVVLAADVFYTRDLAALALRFLQAASRGGADVLAADPGRAFVPAGSLAAVATCDIPVLTVLEDIPVKTVTVYRPR